MREKVVLPADEARRVWESVDVLKRLAKLEPVAREAAKIYRSNVIDGVSKGPVDVWAKRMRDVLEKAGIHHVMHPTIASARLELTSLTSTLVQLEKDLGSLFGYVDKAVEANAFGIGIWSTLENVDVDLRHYEAHLREM
jgi:hypothetical protein